MLKQRIFTAIVMALVLVATIVFTGNAGASLLFALALFVAARELFKNEVGFLHSKSHQWWNPLICKTKVKGWVWIECRKNDKYGRTLVTVYRKRNDTKSVNDKMIESGLVNIYDGGKKKEFIYEDTP